MSHLRVTRSSIVWWMKFGFQVGVALSVLVFIGYLINGEALFHPYGSMVNMKTLTVIYLGGCTIAGLIVALLLPLFRWTVGAWIAGSVAAFPVMTMLEVIMHGFRHWDGGETAITLIASMAIGGGLGVIGRRRHYRPEKR